MTPLSYDNDGIPLGWCCGHDGDGNPIPAYEREESFADELLAARDAEDDDDDAPAGPTPGPGPSPEEEAWWREQTRDDDWAARAVADLDADATAIVAA